MVTTSAMIIVVTNDILARGSPKILLGAKDWYPPTIVGLEINIDHHQCKEMKVLHP